MKARQIVLTKNHENINKKYLNGCLYTILDGTGSEFKEENRCYYYFCRTNIVFCKGLSSWDDRVYLNELTHNKIFKKIKTIDSRKNLFELKKLFCYSTLEIINRNITIDHEFFPVSTFIPNAEEIAKVFYAESKHKKSKMNVEGLKTFFSDKKYIFPKKYENMFKSLEDDDILTIHYTTFYFLNCYSEPDFHESFLRQYTDTPENFWNWLKDFKLEEMEDDINIDELINLL